MIERNVTSSDDQYEFETALDLYNVDQFAVGYYACFDNTVNVKDILSNLMHEPVNNKHVTYLYVYVDGEHILREVTFYLTNRINDNLYNF